MTQANDEEHVGYAQHVGWIKERLADARRGLRRSLDVEDLERADRHAGAIRVGESLLQLITAEKRARHAADPAAARLRSAVAYLERIRDRPAEAQDLAEEALARITPSQTEKAA